MKWMNCLGFVVVGAFAAMAQAAEPASQVSLRPDAESQAERSDPVTYEVDFSAVVTPPYHAKVLKVWMPIPPSNDEQQVVGSQFSTFPEVVEPRIAVEPVYGNKFAYFEFHDPQGAQIIRHQFSATVSNLHWNVVPDRVEQPSKWPMEFEPYLQPQAIAERADFQLVLHEISPQQAGNVRSLFQAMNWIDANLTYNHTDASLQADAEHAFTKRHGHCSDYHGLCATMGRALGFPTRVTYGLALFPKNSPSHCKLEAFLPPYGWVSFDLSETQKLIQAIHKDKTLDAVAKEDLAAAARSRLLTGFRENSWLLMTQGTDYELAPRAARPVRVVRTIYAEADGEALPEPDPANSEKREFGWMTVHQYKPSQPVSNPYKDLKSLTKSQ